ncbi:hypothetical protein [Brevundimonas sp. NIBR11]|uniref:hypothetical protein n=1 Tax=Brevundimonas sp. NIBR11 TaxID=3015999 RepID=UPI0022F071E4|nr:hypothetical protein [Brevundimonas sp. NIBR11]
MSHALVLAALLITAPGQTQTPPTAPAQSSATTGNALTRSLNSAPPAASTAPATSGAPSTSTSLNTPPSTRPAPASTNPPAAATSTPATATPTPAPRATTPAPRPASPAPTTTVPTPAPRVAPPAPATAAPNPAPRATTPTPGATTPGPTAAPTPAPRATVPAPTTIAPAAAPSVAAPAAPASVMTVLDASAIRALPFTVDLPSGFTITSGRPGPNFNIWTIRRGQQPLVMVYAGPASQFPIYSGQMVETPGRASVVATEDGRRVALEHLFTRTTAPTEVHVWITSVEGADRALAEQIGQSVDVR